MDIKEDQLGNNRGRSKIWKGVRYFPFPPLIFPSSPLSHFRPIHSLPAPSHTPVLFSSLPPVGQHGGLLLLYLLPYQAL